MKLKNLIGKLVVKPGTKINRSNHNPGDTAGVKNKEEALEVMEENRLKLEAMQTLLYAEKKRSLLIVLQGMDASGKDGTIRHVMSGVNPQGVHVSSFKVPSAEELNHDFLWRYAQRLPARGEIGIFNRSHYEEVLVVRVHPELLDSERLPKNAKGKDVWKRRYREINDWERYLTDNGIKVVKIFLNISKEEQRVRFLRRLDLPDHNWKFSAGDARERRYWDDYQRAFSEMLSNTSTDWAPWHVIPADRKWFARTCVSAVLAHTLIELNPQYPKVSPAQRREEQKAKAELLAQAPKGAPADPFQASSTATDEEASKKTARKKNGKKSSRT